MIGGIPARSFERFRLRERAKREVTDQHVAFAKDRRATHLGWQSIAAMLGVNVEDLRTACAAKGIG